MNQCDIVERVLDLGPLDPGYNPSQVTLALCSWPQSLWVEVLIILVIPPSVGCLWWSEQRNVL